MARILLIEDERELADALGSLLGRAGHEVLIRGDGQTGIECAQSERPDLIVCDFMMPGMDGLTVVQTLSSQPSTADIPFVFVSAHPFLQDLPILAALPIAGYFAKPFRIREFLAKIEQILAAKAG